MHSAAAPATQNLLNPRRHQKIFCYQNIATAKHPTYIQYFCLYAYVRNTLEHAANNTTDILPTAHRNTLRRLLPYISIFLKLLFKNAQRTLLPRTRISKRISNFFVTPYVCSMENNNTLSFIP
jgi:hypothetical protein